MEKKCKSWLLETMESSRFAPVERRKSVNQWNDMKTAMTVRTVEWDESQLHIVEDSTLSRSFSLLLSHS